MDVIIDRMHPLGIKPHQLLLLHSAVNYLKHKPIVLNSLAGHQNFRLSGLIYSIQKSATTKLEIIGNRLFFHFNSYMTAFPLMILAHITIRRYNVFYNCLTAKKVPKYVAAKFRWFRFLALLSLKNDF